MLNKKHELVLVCEHLVKAKTVSKFYRKRVASSGMSQISDIVILSSLRHGDFLGGASSGFLRHLLHVYSDFPVRVWFSNQQTLRRSYVIFFRLDSLFYWVCKVLSGFHCGRKNLQVKVCVSACNPVRTPNINKTFRHVSVHEVMIWALDVCTCAQLDLIFFLSCVLWWCNFWCRCIIRCPCLKYGYNVCRVAGCSF